MNAAWQTFPLSKLCEKVSVGHVGTTSPYYRDTGVAFLRTQNVGTDGLLLSDLKYITSEFHASLKKSQLKGGDLLLTRVVTDTMKCGIVPPSLGEANCANVILIRPKPELSSRFLHHLIASPLAQTYLLGKRVGSAQQVVNTKILKDWTVPLPPLDEQKRIVTVLDAAFEGLTRARAHAEANLKSARELFASLLLGFQSQGQVEWVEKNLEELVSTDCSLSYGIVQPGDDVSGGLPLVRPTDLGEREIHLEGLKRIDPAKSSAYARTVLQGGELLLCVRGTTGTIGIASPELAGANVTRGIVPVRFDPAQLLQRFGYYSFLSSPVQKQITAATYGAALQQINIRDVRKLCFSYPNLEVQKAILTALDEAYGQTETLQSNYRAKLHDLDDLRQSLLQKAFAGELT
jgi:type I restriction enzyme, S subunit